MVFCNFQIIFEVLYVFRILYDNHKAEPSTQPYVSKEETYCNFEYLLYILSLLVVPPADTII